MPRFVISNVEFLLFENPFEVLSFILRVVKSMLLCVLVIMFINRNPSPFEYHVFANIANSVKTKIDSGGKYSLRLYAPTKE